MKRFSCNDSLTGLLYPPQGEINPKENSAYSREFQAMLDGLDEEDSIEETGQSCDKKRRLSNHQVKSLEKIFEVDNKLDPERKVKVAQELGLQPRQVAIWFQNRRARWKTKQLEWDYTYLKANYDALKLNFQKLEQEKDTLAAELKELKGNLPEEMIEETNEFHSKEKALFWGSKNNVSNQGNDSPYSIELCGKPEPAQTNHDLYTSLNLEPTNGFRDLKDGLSDSDSSGVLNEDTTNLINGQLLVPPQALSAPRFDFSSSLNFSQLLDSRQVGLSRPYHQQYVKMEEPGLVTSSEESCNIFSVDQAPTLCWYFPDQRN